jgi:HAD superfamily hydrolase (TIGR01509 family)
MITNVLLDFSRVIIFPRDNTYFGLLNDLYKKEILEGKSQFLDRFKFNEELLKYLHALKGKYGLSIYTTDIIQYDPAARTQLEPLFENIFAANELKLNKKEPNDYLVIAEKLKCEPQEILFIDDGEQNIKAAQKAGLQTLQFTSNEKLFEQLENII